MPSLKLFGGGMGCRLMATDLSWDHQGILAIPGGIPVATLAALHLDTPAILGILVATLVAPHLDTLATRLLGWVHLQGITMLTDALRPGIPATRHQECPPPQRWELPLQMGGPAHAAEVTPTAILVIVTRQVPVPLRSAVPAESVAAATSAAVAAVLQDVVAATLVDEGMRVLAMGAVLGAMAGARRAAARPRRSVVATVGTADANAMPLEAVGDVQTGTVLAGET